MADIFDEIEEDLKRDQMQMLWTRYGKIVMAVVAAIILLVALRQGYNAWQISRSEESASAYQQALKSDDVIATLEAQKSQFTSGYAMLAQFQIAGEQAARDDFTSAEKSYLTLASDDSLDPLYQQAATLLSVMVAPKDADAALLAARLSDLEATTGPWQAMALETGAGLALRVGNVDAAVAKYKKLMDMADVPASMRQRAERMVVMLGN